MLVARILVLYANGRLREIARTGNELTFRFEPHPEQGYLTRGDIEEFADQLNLHRFEQYRTHWALKDGNLPAALLAKATAQPPVRDVAAVAEELLQAIAEGQHHRREAIDPVEIAFEADIYLLTKGVAAKHKSPEITVTPTPYPEPPPSPKPPDDPSAPVPAPPPGTPAVISILGKIPPEQWNRLGTRLIPKMRAAGSVTAMIRLESEIDPARVAVLSAELQQIIDEIGLSSAVRIERRCGATIQPRVNPKANLLRHPQCFRSASAWPRRRRLD